MRGLLSHLNIVVVMCLAFFLLGCEPFVRVQEYNLHAFVVIDDTACGEALRTSRPSKWPESRTWLLCYRVNGILRNERRRLDIYLRNVSSGNARFNRAYVVDCRDVLLAGEGGWFNREVDEYKYAAGFNVFVQGKITQGHVDSCMRGIDDEVNALRTRLTREKEESDRFWNSFWNWVVSLFLFSSFLAIVFFYGERIYHFLYWLLVPHPAEDAVKQMIKNRSVEALEILHSQLQETSNLFKKPPAPWKSAIMAEKARNLRKRLEVEGDMFSEAIELLRRAEVRRRRSQNDRDEEP